MGDNALWRVPTWFPELSSEVLARLKAFHGELLKFNVRVNLIARSTEREADEVHFADVLYAASAILKAEEGKEIYDVGSGNGFPGIVMGILDPSRHFFLVESDGRKCEFLKHCIGILGLKRMKVMSVRFETLAGQNAEVAVSRGFASISKTVLVANRIFEGGSRIYHLKGPTWSSEIAELPSQVIAVWAPKLIAEYALPVSQASRAVVVTVKNG